jgi:hypothetical protein
MELKWQGVSQPALDLGFNPKYHTQKCWKSQNIKKKMSGHQWLTPVILAIQETEIRKTEFQSQSGQIVQKNLSWKNPSAGCQ